MIDLGLYVIIDPYNIGQNNLYDLVKNIIEGGADTIQLRNKLDNDNEVAKEGRLLKELCSKYQKIFILNDRVEVAKVIHPDGIHVGRDDMPVNKCREIFGENFIIGNSNATIEDANISSQLKLDYVAIGSLFETISKKDTIPSSMNVIKRLKDNGFDKPIVGIGGINKERAKEVLENGADSICVSSAITLSNNPKKETSELKELINKYAK